jgi:hypothetical protein
MRTYTRRLSFDYRMGPSIKGGHDVKAERFNHLLSNGDFDEFGNMVPPENPDRMKEAAMPPSKEKKKRRCLACDKLFSSLSANNRICGPCLKSHRVSFGSASFGANYADCIFYEEIEEDEEEGGHHD